MLKFLQWLKINERSEYKRLVVTFNKVLITSEPTYLSDLISVQPLRSTRSSTVVTFLRPCVSAHKITNRFLRYRGINFMSHYANRMKLTAYLSHRNHKLCHNIHRHLYPCRHPSTLSPFLISDLTAIFSIHPSHRSVGLTFTNFSTFLLILKLIGFCFF